MRLCYLRKVYPVRLFARRLYDGRYQERKFGGSFCGEVAPVHEVVILELVDWGKEVGNPDRVGCLLEYGIEMVLQWPDIQIPD